jgi:hypothetical protein
MGGFILVPKTYAAVLWTGDMEEADMRDWYAPQGSVCDCGNNGGGEFNNTLGKSSAATDVIHTGKYAAKLTITANGIDTGVRLFRWVEAQQQSALYYSTWYYIPQKVQVTGGWWNIFEWKSTGGKCTNCTGNDPLWTLIVANRPDSSMYLQLHYWPIPGRAVYTQQIKDLPVGRWFRIEAFYKESASNQGQIIVWQDGTEIFNKSGVQTMFTGHPQWAVTNYANTLSPTQVTTYVDDASISTTRESVMPPNSNEITPTPPVTSAPTSSPSSGKQLNLTVFLHGIGKGGDNVNAQSGGNTTPQHPQRQVVVEFYNANNQHVKTGTGMLSFNATAGNFTGSMDIGDVAAGSYTAKIKVPQYLKKGIPGIITLPAIASATVGPISLTTGDANNDNTLSILDYNMLLDCFSDISPAKNCNDANKKLATDFTDDGKVNQFDYNLFLRELSVQSGE